MGVRQTRAQRRRGVPATMPWVFAALLLLAASCSGDTATAVGDRGSGATSEATAPNDIAGTEAVAVDTEPTATPEPTPTPTGPTPIRIVTMMGETGVMRPLDAPAVAGVVAFVEQLNESGGLLGRQVEVTRIDTESRVSLAERFAERLLDDPPDLVVVSCDVEFSKPVLELADEAGVITVSPCADDVGYATAAWGTRNFAFGAPAEPRGSVAAEAAIARYGTTAMVLRDRTSPEALRFCNGFERTFRELGGSVAYRDEFTYDTPEPLLDRLAERGRPTDLIVMCSHVPGGSDAAPNVIEQIRLLGFEAPIVSGSTLDEPSWFASAPLLDELTYVSWSSIFGNDPDGDINALIRSANDNEDTPLAGMSTVLGADSIDAWARSVEAVQSVDPNSVAAAMGSISNEAFLTGAISFASGSRLDAGRTYRVIQVIGGSVQEPELAIVEG